MSIVGKMSKEELRKRLAEMRAYNQENPTDGMWYNPENPDAGKRGVKPPKPPKPPKPIPPPSVEQLAVLQQEEEYRTFSLLEKFTQREKYKAQKERKQIADEVRAEISIGLGVALEKAPQQADSGIRKATFGAYGLKDLEDPEVYEKAITIMANVRKVGQIVGIKDYMTGTGPIGQQKPTKMLGSVVSALKRTKKEETLLDKTNFRKKEIEEKEHRKRLEKSVGIVASILSKVMPDWLNFMNRGRGGFGSSMAPSKKTMAGVGITAGLLGLVNSGDKNNIYGKAFDAIIPESWRKWIQENKPDFIKENAKAISLSILGIAAAVKSIGSFLGVGEEGGVGVGGALAAGFIGSKLGSIAKGAFSAVKTVAKAGIGAVAGGMAAEAMGAGDQGQLIGAAIGAAFPFMLGKIPAIIGPVLTALMSKLAIGGLAAIAGAFLLEMGMGYMTDGTVAKVLGNTKLAQRDPEMVKKVAKATGKKPEDLTDDDYAKYIGATQSPMTQIANFLRGKENQQFHVPEDFDSWTKEDQDKWLKEAFERHGKKMPATPVKPLLPPVSGTELDDVKPRKVPLASRVINRRSGKSSGEQDAELKATIAAARLLKQEVDSKNERVPSMYGDNYDAPRLNWNQRRTNDRLQQIDKKPEGVRTRKDAAPVIIDNSVKNSNNTTGKGGGAPTKHGVGSAVSAPNPMQDMALWGVPQYIP